MSHFSVGMIMPTDMKNRSEDKVISELLKPYDEGIEVPQYKRDCYCINMAASDHGRKAADKAVKDRKLKSVDTLRKEYWAMPEKKRPEWTDYIKETVEVWDSARKSATKAHPLYNKPSDGCEECRSTGKTDSTYNPKSKWDWWTVGGRWTGSLAEIEPQNNPANLETCFVCGGTGKRDDELGRKERAKDPKYTCNGCDGKGKSLKHPPDWVDEGNRCKTDELVSEVEDGRLKRNKNPFFALVTPKGEWLERGKMGMFAMVSNEKGHKDWDDDVKGVLRKFPGHTIVVVDCHI